jgi:hypothetical protein
VDPHPVSVLIDRTPYNESRYLAALQKRQSPLLKFAAAQPL